MSSLLKNNTLVNGVRRYYAYALRVKLPAQFVRVTLPESQDRLHYAKDKQEIANQVEQEAKEKPYQKDHQEWVEYLYSRLGVSDILDKKKKAKEVREEKENHLVRIEEAFDKMIKHKQKLNHIQSIRTIELYMTTCRYMVECLGNIPIRDYSEKVHAKFFQYLKKVQMRDGTIGMKDTTINIHQRAIKSLTNWCFKKHLIDRYVDIEMIAKIPAKENNYISPSQLNEICSADSVSKPMAAYFKIAYNTGLRLRELNTDPENKAFLGLYHLLEKDDQGDYRIRVFGKGRKKGNVVLPKDLFPTYKVMLDNPYQPSSITIRFKEACREVGYPQFHFHNLRASFGDNLIKSGNDPFVIMKAMRHSSLAVTDQYIKDEEFGWQQLKSKLILVHNGNV